MKTILVINDHSPEAIHAAKVGLLIAQHHHADLLLANCQTYAGKTLERAVAGGLYKDTGYARSENYLLDDLQCFNQSVNGFKPQISLAELSGAGEVAIAEFAAKNQVEMIVCGVMPDAGNPRSKLSNSKLLKKINCPLLLVPYGWEIKNIERMCYIAELRYCRLDVVTYLAHFAAPWPADVSIAHLCAKSLPEMEAKYAQTVFEQQYQNKVNYPRLLFTPVGERDVRLAVDVFIHAMNTDILVLVNQCFHFQDALGGSTVDHFPAHITVPLLIFP
ncbi:universal stress protein [Mucilaginibacter gracilis]|nr:universal stress protein [Mucilaginibacter gracilis]